MKNKTPFLDFYYKCMETGRMRKSGLCKNFKVYGAGRSYMGDVRRKYEVFKLFDCSLQGYWAHTPDTIYYEGEAVDFYLFTPLRQTIVLLCAAMNNEL